MGSNNACLTCLQCGVQCACSNCKNYSGYDMVKARTKRWHKLVDTKHQDEDIERLLSPSCTVKQCKGKIYWVKWTTSIKGNETDPVEKRNPTKILPYISCAFFLSKLQDRPSMLARPQLLPLLHSVLLLLDQDRCSPLFLSWIRRGQKMGYSVVYWAI